MPLGEWAQTDRSRVAHRVACMCGQWHGHAGPRAWLTWAWETRCTFSEEFVIRLLGEPLDNLFTLQCQLRVRQEGSTSSSIPIPPLQMGTGPTGPSTSSHTPNTPNIKILVQPWEPRLLRPGKPSPQQPCEPGLCREPLWESLPLLLQCFP